MAARRLIDESNRVPGAVQQNSDAVRRSALRHATGNGRRRRPGSGKSHCRASVNVRASPEAVHAIGIELRVSTYDGDCLRSRLLTTSRSNGSLWCSGIVVKTAVCFGTIGRIRKSLATMCVSINGW